MSAYQLAEQKTYVKKIKKTSDDLYLIEQEVGSRIYSSLY